MLPGRVVRGKPNPLHWKFRERLRRARRAAKLSASALSLSAGVGRSTVSMMELGTRLPRLPMVERLAEALHISPAFLAFGIDAPYEPVEGVQLRSHGFAERAQQARTARRLTLREVARRLESSASAVRTLEAGTMPTLNTIEDLANALKISPAWLAFGIGPMELRQLKRPAQVLQA